MTIEGDSYTIKELIQKHILGQLPDVGREPIYNNGSLDDYDLEKVRDYDLAERDEVMNSNSLKINDLKEKLVKKVQEPIAEPLKVQNEPVEGE